MPLLRLTNVIVTINLFNLSGVLDWHIVRSAEIGEDIVAGTVPTRPPLDRVTMVTHAPNPQHHRVNIRDLKRDVV
jgi:hypothetical protein